MICTVHIKLGDALYRYKWKRMTRWNWNDRTSESDAESWIWIERFREKNPNISIFFSAHLNGVLFLMFCLLVEWEWQILVF